MNNEVKHWIVVPAAGSGRRMASDVPKQYLPLNGVSVLSHTLTRLHQGIHPAAIVVALSAGDSSWPDIEKPDCKIIAIEGGRERCDSVLNGLHALVDLASPDDWVWVHDAARPCVRIHDLQRLKETIKESEVGGLLALNITDTVKQADERQYSVKTLDRKELWRALTPQVFRYRLLHDALTDALQAGYKVTDEAQAIELIGQTPQLIEGNTDNIKITKQGDLDIAALYLQRQTLEE